MAVTPSQREAERGLARKSCSDRFLQHLLAEIVCHCQTHDAKTMQRDMPQGRRYVISRNEVEAHTGATTRESSYWVWDGRPWLLEELRPDRCPRDCTEPF